MLAGNKKLTVCIKEKMRFYGTLSLYNAIETSQRILHKKHYRREGERWSYPIHASLTSWAAEDISHHFTVPFEDVAHAYFDWGYGRSSQKTHLTWK